MQRWWKQQEIECCKVEYIAAIKPQINTNVEKFFIDVFICFYEMPCVNFFVWINPILLLPWNHQKTKNINRFAQIY